VDADAVDVDAGPLPPLQLVRWHPRSLAAGPGCPSANDRRYHVRFRASCRARTTTFAITEVPHVANIKSQIKRNRQNEKARQRNKQVRSEIQTRTKKVLGAAAGGEETAESLKEAIKRIDSATSKGVLHKNTAARKKSRLVKQVRRLEEAAASES
jgi:small subunit ribosomal protein S20